MDRKGKGGTRKHPGLKVDGGASPSKKIGGRGQEVHSWRERKEKEETARWRDGKGRKNRGRGAPPDMERGRKGRGGERLQLIGGRGR